MLAVLTLWGGLAFADDPAPRQGWFGQIRYAVGVSTQLGGGTDGTVYGHGVVAEPVAFELRSFLWPRVAFHTTLDLTRMIAPAIATGDGRIDYDCHLGVHLPVRPDLTVVVAPGAAIAYSFTKSRYQRIMGDARIGVDLEHGRWSTGFYLRPYAGWWREVGQAEGRPAGGVVVEMVNVFHVPTKADRAEEARSL